MLAESDTTSRSLSDLDFGFLGSTLLEVVDHANIPYDYLSEKTRIGLRQVYAEVIRPSFQDRLRNGHSVSVEGFRQEITRNRNEISPGNFSPFVFLWLVKRTIRDKFALQRKIAELLRAYTRDLISDELFVNQGKEMLARSLQLEPLYFATSANIKSFIDFMTEKVISSGTLSDREIDLLTLPGIPVHYITYDMDLKAYCLAEDKEKFRQIQNRYFNADTAICAYELSLRVPEYQAIIGDRAEEIIAEMSRVEADLRNRWTEKVYLVLERSLPLVREIDELLLIDNCFDKYVESKLCFMHDLFLRIQIAEVENGSKKYLDELIDDKDLEPRLVTAIWSW